MPQIMKETQFGDILFLLFFLRHQRKYLAFPDRVFLLIVANVKIAGESTGNDMTSAFDHIADHYQDILDTRPETHIDHNIPQRDTTVCHVLGTEQIVERFPAFCKMVISDHCRLVVSLLTLQS